jgi:hypothetical protein
MHKGSNMFYVCGKVVNSVGIAYAKVVGVHPQNYAHTVFRPTQAGYNPTFMPVLSVHYPHFYPQVILAKIDLLRGVFSPLSTAPTIKTTNLKNQER